MDVRELTDSGEHVEWKRRNDEALKRRGFVDDGTAKWEGADETVPAIVVSVDRRGHTLGVQEFRTRAEAEASVRMFRRRRETGRRQPCGPGARPRAHRRVRRSSAPTRGSPSGEDSPEPHSGGWGFLAFASRRMLEHERRREAKRAFA